MLFGLQKVREAQALPRVVLFESAFQFAEAAVHHLPRLKDKQHKMGHSGGQRGSEDLEGQRGGGVQIRTFLKWLTEGELLGPGTAARTGHVFVDDVWRC